MSAILGIIAGIGLVMAGLGAILIFGALVDHWVSR